MSQQRAAPYLFVFPIFVHVINGILEVLNLELQRKRDRKQANHRECDKQEVSEQMFWKKKEIQFSFPPPRSPEMSCDCSD